MNQQRSSDQPFEEIRILGLEPADDEVEPGRSVFGGEPSFTAKIFKILFEQYTW